MILITCVFLVLSILITRRHRYHGSTRHIILMVGAWIGAFITFVLIVINQPTLFLRGPELLPFDWFLVSRTPSLGSNIEWLVTAKNFSIAFFYYEFISFILSFTRPRNDPFRKRRFLFAIPVIFGAALLDPAVARIVSSWNAKNAGGLFINLTILFKGIAFGVSVLYWAYVSYGIFTLIKYTYGRPRLRRLQHSIQALSIAVSIFAVLFSVFFGLSPKLSTIPIFLPPYTRVAFFELPSPSLILKLLTLAQFLTLGVLLVSFVRLLNSLSADSFKDTRLRNSLRVASLSSRVMGHIIKNQLFALQCELQSIVDEMKSKDSESAEKLLSVILSINRLSGSLGKTMDMLRAPKLRMERCTIGILIRGVVDRWKEDHPNIHIDVKCSSEDLFVFADPFHLTEVIVNILNNAAQAMKSVEQPRLSIEAMDDPYWINVRIIDNGPGIREAEARDLFEPFYSRGKGGVNWGVGLTYCKMIINAHDGIIEIGNAPQGGAQVVFSIPRVDPWQYGY